MKTRFGIIGLGGIAARFANAMQAVDGAELVAVASKDKSKAEAFAKKFSAKKAYNSYEDLVNDSEVDVIYIGLTHNFHFEAVKLCINNNKGVLCEKPMTTNKKDAEVLAALAKEKNVLLMEAMWTRCLPAFIKAKEWVHTGKIGAAKLINASFCINVPFDPENRLFNPKLAGGSIYDVGVYPIDFAIGIMDEYPEVVTGLSTICETGVDEFAVINMSFKSGVLASLSCGATAKANTDAAIYGTDGHIIVREFYGSRKCELYNNQNELIESFDDDIEDGFIHEIRHFVELYTNNKKESDRMPLKDTIECAGIFDKLIKQ